MTGIQVFSLLFAGAALLSAQTPAGWKMVKDKSGACQMAVPPDWEVNKTLPSMATAPDKSDAMVISQTGRTLKPISAVGQQAIGAEKMIENTAQRTFWAGKPVSLSGLPAVVGYHVTVPGKDGTCGAQITIPKGGSEELVKKIAATLAPAK